MLGKLSGVLCQRGLMPGYEVHNVCIPNDDGDNDMYAFCTSTPYHYHYPRITSKIRAEIIFPPHELADDPRYLVTFQVLLNSQGSSSTLSNPFITSCSLSMSSVLIWQLFISSSIFASAASRLERPADFT